MCLINCLIQLAFKNLDNTHWPLVVNYGVNYEVQFADDQVLILQDKNNLKYMIKKI